MAHGHETIVCSCGTVIVQCRCMGPKDRRVVTDGCDKCKQRPPVPRVPGPYSGT
jgi:hypothetical protein